MNTVTSKHGTTIAYDEIGSGPVVILVDGALQYRAFDQGMAQLADRLAPHYTVIHYDRRGRGDSGDTLPYALEREIEDIEALINAVGESAFLFGVSSGASLAMEAALKLGGRVRGLAMYEPPYLSDEAAQAGWKQYRRDIDELIAAGRKGDAVARFMKLVGASDEDIAMVRQMPDWPKWEAIGHTLAYDAAAVGPDQSIPVERAAHVAVPALVMAGEASFPFMLETARMLAEVIPQAQLRTLEGQTHEASAEALAPVLEEFFAAVTARQH